MIFPTSASLDQVLALANPEHKDYPEGFHAKMHDLWSRGRDQSRERGTCEGIFTGLLEGKGEEKGETGAPSLTRSCCM